MGVNKEKAFINYNQDLQQPTKTRATLTQFNGLFYTSHTKQGHMTQKNTKQGHGPKRRKSLWKRELLNAPLLWGIHPTLFHFFNNSIEKKYPFIIIPSELWIANYYRMLLNFFFFFLKRGTLLNFHGVFSFYHTIQDWGICTKRVEEALKKICTLCFPWIYESMKQLELLREKNETFFWSIKKIYIINPLSVSSDSLSICKLGFYIPNIIKQIWLACLIFLFAFFIFHTPHSSIMHS